MKKSCDSCKHAAPLSIINKVETFFFGTFVSDRVCSLAAKNAENKIVGSIVKTCTYQSTFDATLANQYNALVVEHPKFMGVDHIPVCGESLVFHEAK